MQLPPIQVINALFPFLYHGDLKTRSSAIVTLALTVARLANQDMEGARNVVRRLMWNLNDESGGIGWGSPEALGEILARHEDLAREYVHILVSYARRDANFIENEILQRGLLWAILRVWQAWPALLAGAKLDIHPYLESKDAAVRGLSAELAGRSGDHGLCGMLALLLEDDSAFESPMEEPRPPRRRVQDAAKQAIEKIGCG